MRVMKFRLLGLGLAVPLIAFACSSSNDGSSQNGGGDGGADTSTDAAPTCPSSFADPVRERRDACTFAAGAKATDTLGLTEDQRKAIPIKHVIVLMKENRSFDHLFGQLSKSGQPDAEAVPATWASKDANGAAVPPYHATTTCEPADPPHQWDPMHAQVNGGAMDGFVKSGSNSSPATDGHFTMGYLDATDLPFYYWLANTFAIADHHFPSVQSGTWANRDYLVAATSNGVKNTGPGPGTGPQLDGVPLIFDKLSDAKVTWGVYTDDPFPLEASVAWGGRPNLKTVDAFLSEVKAGTLPAVSFIDGTSTLGPPPARDEHPPSDVQAGEAWTKSIFDAVVQSSIWSDTVIFYTYDEAGGFGDHVPPGKSCAASPDQAEFTELGVRVPLIAISPWAKRHFVSHAVHQHTSILRFIELLHGIPALTARDANSDALLDMFDFSCPNTTPLGDAPAPGTGRCTQ